MTPERWAVLEPLLDTALELPPERRGGFIAQVTAGDGSLGAELERLVEQCEREHTLLDRPAVERFPVLLGEEAAAGEDIRARLQAGLGDAYTLEGEIGGGGMSRVFVAREAALGRRVVIKTLSPELAAGFSAERFARETRLAASLQQANIVPLLAAGSAEGLPYYTMPYVEGHSLRHRLGQEGALPIAEAVGILRDVARALTYAHAHGVIHRDIKPANVLLSGGTAMVTDFGIAKAFGAARGPGLEDTLTSAGTGLGTAAYMAPEQAAGDPAVDHRADLYAFGCVAYEMLAGRPPFEGDAHEVIAAHFRRTPRPVTELRPDLPPGIAGLIARCMEKDPARRPESAAELLRALDGMAGLPVVRGRWRRPALVALALALVGVAIPLAEHLAGPAPAPPLTLAALPFTNVTHDTTLEVRSQGISDEVLASVGKLPGVRVTGRTAAYAFRGRPHADLGAVERELGARLLLTGTLRQGDGRIIVSAELHDSTGGRTLLSGTFTRDSREFGALTEDVAQAVADTLRARFGGRFGGARTGISTTGTTSAEALDQYLLGQALLKRRGSGVQQSVAAFEHAIALDPRFARAYAALATALQFYPYFVGTPPEEISDRTLNAAHRALELDSSLADAHGALGAAYAKAGHWEESSAEFRRALALQPDNVAAHFNFGRLLVSRGATDEGLAQLEQARALERVSPLISAWLAYGYFVAGRRDAARAEIERAVQLDSTLLPVSNLGALMALAQGRKDEARRLMAAPLPVTTMTNAPYVFARLGDTVTANRLLRAMEANQPRPWFTDAQRASVRLAVGDTAGALAALETCARASGPPCLLLIPIPDPAYDPLRRSPRFAALLRQAGLDVALLTRPHGGRR